MADNLNQTYLGQPGSSDNLTTPFLPETASEATINLRSDVSTVGELHAQGDAVIGGTLAVTGVTTLSAALASASAISGGALTATSGAFSDVITSSDVSGNFLSVGTFANDSEMEDGDFRIVQAASGVSLAYRSGSTTYYIGDSTVSEA